MANSICSKEQNENERDVSATIFLWPNYFGWQGLRFETFTWMTQHIVLICFFICFCQKASVFGLVFEVWMLYHLNESTYCSPVLICFICFLSVSVRQHLFLVRYLKFSTWMSQHTAHHPLLKLTTSCSCISAWSKKDNCTFFCPPSIHPFENHVKLYFTLHRRIVPVKNSLW